MQRKKPSMPTEKRGQRLVNGVRWAWFCSRQCNGQAVGYTDRSGERALAGTRANQAKARERALRRLIEACKSVADVEGRVPIKAIVKVLMTEGRRDYLRGYAAGLYRERQRWERGHAA